MVCFQEANTSDPATKQHQTMKLTDITFADGFKMTVHAVEKKTGKKLLVFVTGGPDGLNLEQICMETTPPDFFSWPSSNDFGTNTEANTNTGSHDTAELVHSIVGAGNCVDLTANKTSVLESESESDSDHEESVNEVDKITNKVANAGFESDSDDSSSDGCEDTHALSQESFPCAPHRSTRHH